MKTHESGHAGIESQSKEHGAMNRKEALRLWVRQAEADRELRLDGETRPQLIASDHKLDAFLSASSPTPRSAAEHTRYPKSSPARQQKKAGYTSPPCYCRISAHYQRMSAPKRISAPREARRATEISGIGFHRVSSG